MPENWNTYKLGDLIEHQKGFAFKSKWYQNSGAIVVRVSDTTDNSIDVSTCNKIDKDLASSYERFKIQFNDIVIATVGSWPPNYASVVGKVIKVPQEADGSLLNQNAVRLRTKNPEKVDQKFIYYLMKSNTFLKYIVHSAQGSANQASIKLTDIFNFSFSLPKISEQKSIASILSALDDKIELNLQMNKTLEEIAMALYKHWFVDFGPFQDGDFEESELGEIPKGWEVLSLSDVTSKITDGAHHSPKSVEEGKPMASVKDMDQWGFNIETCRKISEEDYIKLTNQGCRPLKNDVVIAKDGSYLKHAFVIEKDLDIVLLSSIAILKPNGKLNPHLLNLNLKLDSVKTRMKAIVSGAAIQRIVLKEFRKFLIIVPPKHIQDSALQSIENLMEQCWNNNSENQTLTQLRDTLLPKLISGEVRVKDVEKTLTEVL